MAYAIYTTDDDSRQKIVSVSPTLEAATAAVDTSKGEVVHPDALTDDIEPGWWLVNETPQRLAPPTASETLAEKREELKEAWRLREAEFRAAWAVHTSSKASDYQRWIEMNCRAVNEDDNLNDNALLEVLQTEADIPGPVWHTQHSPTLWANLFPDANASPPRAWAYYATGDGETRHSRGGVAHTGMAMTTDDDFDYAHFLHG